MGSTIKNQEADQPLFDSFFEACDHSHAYLAAQMLRCKKGLEGWGCGGQTQNTKPAGLSQLARTPEVSFRFLIMMRVPMHVLVCLGLSVEGE